MTDLSVVVPAYDEAGSVRRFLTDLDAEIASAGLGRCEVVLVDDGSSDSTGDIAESSTTSVPVRVLRQVNLGRFEARRTGIRAAAYDRILLVDCGLTLTPGSLGFLREQLETHPERELWNGHVDIDTTGNPYAAFWSGLVRIFWGAYLRRPALTSFGLEEFDRYPKGTGLFLAPAALLRDAVESFEVGAGAARFASDDTRLLRSLLAASPLIWISPEFGCTYIARSTLRQFASHSTFRGTTFVDGYWESTSLIGRLVRTAAWLGPLLAVALVVGLVLAPVAVLAALLVLVVLAVLVLFAVALWSGSAARVAAWTALLLPVFAVAFGLGAVRGLWLRFRGRRAAA